MKFVCIIGGGAVGKMTVGQELEKITGLKLFHNHMTIEPVLELFGSFDTDVILKLRETIFKGFAKTDNKGMIFTCIWCFDEKSDWKISKKIRKIFMAQNAECYYVELVASQEEKIRRNSTENRLKHKKSKRDVLLSDERNKIIEEHRVESLDGEFPYDNYIKIDNTDINASDVAKMIKEKFNL